MIKLNSNYLKYKGELCINSRKFQEYNGCVQGLNNVIELSLTFIFSLLKTIYLLMMATERSGLSCPGLSPEKAFLSSKHANR